MAHLTINNLNAYIRRITECMPKGYELNIRASRHFIKRCMERQVGGQFNLTVDILETINKNIPLILYYTKLDTILPERGRLESDKYVICGDVICGEFVLRTIYPKA